MPLLKMDEDMSTQKAPLFEFEVPTPRKRPVNWDEEKPIP
jgi:hypothetical protein